MLNREQALELLKKYNESEALVRHGLTVEAAMREFARLSGEDEEYWGIVGLLHDIDYEKWPEEHCKKAPELLREAGFDESFIHSVVSHGYGLCADVEPTAYMEKVIYTIDELTGLVAATAIMRPSKSILDLEVKSVKKKYKDKRFAAGVNRDVINKGCEMIDMPLDEVIAHTIDGMRAAAEEIGLKGDL